MTAVAELEPAEAPAEAATEREPRSRGVSTVVRVRRSPIQEACERCLAAVLLAPVWVLGLLASSPALLQGRSMRRRDSVGRNAEALSIVRWPRPVGRLGKCAARLGLLGGPLLWQAACGRMSFVGPRPRTLREFVKRGGGPELTTKPGLLSLRAVKRWGNCAFGSERDTDEAYLRNKSWSFDWGLLARAPLAWLQSSRGRSAQRKVFVAGVPLDNLTMREALDEIEAAIDGGGSRQICFVNADCVNLAAGDREYADLLRSGPLVLPDGSGVRLAARLVGGRLRENVNGTDLFPLLCERLAARSGRLFLLGAAPGAAAQVARCAQSQHPGLQVVGIRHGYFTEDQEAEIVSEIRAARPDVLLVAMGAPRQEKWIARTLEDCGARAAIGVGGLFDFYSRRVPRAPAWLREIGMEWAYRLLQEPGRLWRRYLVGNVLFVARVLRSGAAEGPEGPTAA